MWVVASPAIASQEDHLPQVVPTASSFSTLDFQLASLARFPERLTPSRAPTAAETEQLKILLSQYSHQSDFERLTLLEKYLKQYPDSPWRLALRLNLGQLDFRQGYYERAIQAYKQAWQEGQQDAAHETRLIGLRDAAVGQLLRMYASLGDKEQLQALLDELGSQKLYGAAGQFLAITRGGLWHMISKWTEAYRCGPAALTSIV
ncbi:MAG: hypothetical protein LBU72_09615 [Burkholderiaceae bacterium]|nr:hypothetical protein [Burkholderiaceae bacterium]